MDINQPEGSLDSTAMGNDLAPKTNRVPTLFQSMDELRALESTAGPFLWPSTLPFTGRGEPRGDLAFEVCRGRIGEVGEDRTLLEATGFARSEHAFDETTAGFALRSEREFAIDHGWTKCALGRVVRGFDALDVDEGPQPITVIPELLTHPLNPWIAAVDTTQQERIEFLPDRGHVRLKYLPVDLAVLVTLPMCEHRLDLPHQIAPQAFYLGIGTPFPLVAARISPNLPL